MSSPQPRPQSQPPPPPAPPPAEGTPDLNAVMAAVGYQVFSFLPLGSLLRGRRSPMLVNTVFHDGLFQCLGQAETLSLSQCRHLRRIDDDQLVTFIRNIVEVGEAHHPGYARRVHRRRAHRCAETSACPCPIKVKHLDLSRCRAIRGDGVHFCLKHMPGVERVFLSHCSKFDASNCFAALGDLHASELTYLDVGGCPDLDTIGIKRLVTTLQGKWIRHLDFSGCSQFIDDSVAGTVAFCLNLECLNLSNAGGITTFGVGIIAYVTRNTLRCLSIRGCDQVHLPKLLMAASDELIELAGSDDDHRALPPNYAGDSNDRSLYIAALCSVLVQMMRVHDNVGEILHMSQRYMASFKKLDEKWSTVWGLSGDRDRGARMFGNLEVLDLGHVGSEDIRLEGCLATIAWLNGGKLKQVDLEGLKSVSHFDISVLGSTSGTNLKRLNASAMTEMPSEHSACFFFHTMKNILELDLSGCNFWEGNSKGVALVFLTGLRSLKLDYTNITDSILVTVLTKCMKLLRLSVRECRELHSRKICAAKLVNRNLNLLELDCRHINLNAPLRKMQEVYPSLLRLNGKITKKGTKLLKAHQSSYLWRIGEREPTGGKKRKRKRDGTLASSGSAPNGDSAVPFHNCCTIMMMGFSCPSTCEQEVFGCKTCSIDFGNYVCMACARQCHDGHEIFSAGYGAGCCDCCIFSECKCLEECEV
ncbi:hypothetical protein ACHAWF_013743 [Thalassiosira exigua]